ncbi:PAS domain-containing sensor histidine kinase [Xanthomonas sp. WHRI 8391]|uniref:histidine kinase n=3 Tax=Xanthomonas TaxID=338 RepID=A0A6V7DLV2_9XANT|nr:MULTISPECIES: PAS domain-containing sensor histidine kinase [Xanthomonas]MBG3849113.1 PAS domain S-box protein [Xanthomonas hortorum pv. carotae]UTS72210.1 PAS domain-containing sensor histidine kinase [Xanthomonas hortorum]WAH62398.1 PAS domain-containing sensor histidine kinase [Xanthomonas hortorum]WOB49408.1 PAS domain-containing sensor histidine kinase [Xanthomonas hydrangeae]CAD0336705.1 Sensor protein FixL [Xanthomonas hortorum pv. carotae]
MDRLRLPFKWRGQVVRLNRAPTLWASLAMLALLVLAEWYSHLGVSLGLLYILPVVLAATVLSRRNIVIAAVACAALRGLFVTEESLVEQALRFFMATIAYAGCGLLVAEISRTRRVILSHYVQLRAEQRLRRRLERQLRLLAESSPAALLTVAGDGRIVAANRAAHEILDMAEEGGLQGRAVRDFLPLLDDALSMSANLDGMRTSASTWGRRDDGSTFPATTWFSVYEDSEERHLAAILVDTSEEVRARESAHFDDLLKNNRLLAGAVSHEIRNLCSAAGVVTSNLARHPAIRADPDLAALQSLVAALMELASFNLRRQTPHAAHETRLQTLCSELDVIIRSDWDDIDGQLVIQIPADFPAVHGDRHALLQVLLNLARNALRAVQPLPQPRRQLIVSARMEQGSAVLSVRDTGPGIAEPGRLFQPFRSDSDGSGLGLYISRALMSNQEGALRYAPGGEGACFELHMPLAHAPLAETLDG